MKVYIIPAFVLIYSTFVYCWQCPTVKDGASLDSKLYEGQQKFTLKFLEEALKHNSLGSIFFSPHSIYRALLLAYFGSDGATETALANGLHLDVSHDKSEVFTAYKHDKDQLTENTKLETAMEFVSVDKFFFDKKVEIRDCMKSLFTDEIELLDIENKPSDAKNYINSWVEQVTRNNIKNLLSDLDNSSKLIVANAAYFKGFWTEKFDAEKTKKQTFYKTPSDTISVDMMNHFDKAGVTFKKDLDSSIIELPYNTTNPNGNAVSFIAVLPNKKTENALEDMLHKLTPEIFYDILKKLSKVNVDLSIPKFTFEQETELVPILKNMGLGQAFSKNAEFSGFSETTKVLFNEAIHKAKIQVDESGTTASSATALFFNHSAPYRFIADHPFFYTIYDHNTKLVLFAGVYKGPE